MVEEDIVTLLVADNDAVALPDLDGVPSPLTDIRGETVASALLKAVSDVRYK